MLDALLALTLVAAQTPKVAYKPDPAQAADVGTVSLAMPHNSCFGVARGAVLMSASKQDRAQRVYVLTITLADASGPTQILGAQADGAPLRMVSVRNGDVACNDYNCPTGSAAVFALEPVRRDAALSVKVSTTGGPVCGAQVTVEAAVFAALDSWADNLPKSRAR